MERSTATKSRAKEVREISAGGIVFRRDGRKIQFAIMKDSYDKWTFPKGRVEAGEDLEEAAARETLEELGLTEIRLLESLGKIDIWFRDRFEKEGALVHKDIHYFLFETPSNASFVIDPAQHVKEAKWVSLSQVDTISSYKDMSIILKRALDFVKKIAT